MRFIGIVGIPHGGRTTLSMGIQAQGFATRVGWEDFRAEIESGTSSCASESRLLVAKGEQVSDELAARVWFELVHQRSEALDVVMDGFPRSLEEQIAFEAFSDMPLPIVYLDASPEVVDRWRAEAGLPAIEESHPDATQRIGASMDEIVEHARRVSKVVEIDGSRPPSEVVSVVASVFWEGSAL